VVIHDIKVNYVATCRKHRVNFFAKSRKVGRQNRRGNQVISHNTPVFKYSWIILTVLYTAIKLCGEPKNKKAAPYNN
jgi:hypothetical protein